MLNVSVGSKVFIFGEYAILDGGVASVFCFEPRFNLKVKVGTGDLQGIPVGSPAYKLFVQDPAFFQKFDFEFEDPHQGAGGCGASTAQFAALSAFYFGRGSASTLAQLDLDFYRIWKIYRTLAYSGVGIKPSGADLLAQFMGGVSLVQSDSGQFQNLPWPFEDHTAVFFATNEKVPTHVHLEEVRDISFSGLVKLSNELRVAMREGLAGNFGLGINRYDEEMRRLGLVASSAEKILDDFNFNENVIAKKGCGAMGADIVMLFIKKTDLVAVRKTIMQKGYERIFEINDKTGGISFSGSLE